VKLLPAIALIAGGVFVLSKLSAAGVASRLNLFISSYSLSITGIYPVINIVVTAQNVTSSDLQFSALAANVFLNGTLIGNISGFTSVLIPATAQVNIPLQATINASQVISDVVAILSGSAQVAAVIEIKGTANVSGLILPIDLITKAV
jgi:hypothetical protein